MGCNGERSSCPMVDVDAIAACSGEGSEAIFGGGLASFSPSLDEDAARLTFEDEVAFAPGLDSLHKKSNASSS